MDNQQAAGYFLMACKSAGLKKIQTDKLLGELHSAFDLYTEEEAEERGFEWYNSLYHNPSHQMSSKKDHIKPKKTTRLPDDYEPEIVRKNKDLLNLLWRIKD